MGKAVFPALALTCAVLAQSGKAPTFEVASVKPAAPDTNAHGMTLVRGGPGSKDPGRASFTNVSLMNLLIRAYDAKPFQIIVPGWLDEERYDVVVKVPDGATKEEFNLLLQALLAERFHLVLHHESKDLQGYELAAGKNGPKLNPSPAADSHAAPPFVPGMPPKADANGFPQLDGPGLIVGMKMEGRAPVAHLTAKSQPISALVRLVSGSLRCPVVDKTGLTGNYDFRLEYAPDGGRLGGTGVPPPPSGPGAVESTENSVPNLLTAIQEQLGLKLAAKKVPVDMLIIDRVDKAPTEN